jgi:hypothetical protein
MAKPRKRQPQSPDPLLQHEALDRAFVCLDIFDRLVESHPYVKRSARLRKAAESTTKSLYQFYQLVASESANSR